MILIAEMQIYTGEEKKARTQAEPLPEKIFARKMAQRGLAHSTHHLPLVAGREDLRDGQPPRLKTVRKETRNGTRERAAKTIKEKENMAVTLPEDPPTARAKTERE